MTDQIPICYIKYVSKIYDKLHEMKKIIFTNNESVFIKNVPANKWSSWICELHFIVWRL